MMGSSLEGLVDGPVPAEEGAGAEEDEPQDGQAEAHALVLIRDEVRQAGQQVEEQSHAVHWRISRETTQQHEQSHGVIT